MSANVATAGVVDLEHPPTMLRVLVAAWPVLAFFGGSLLVHSRKPHEDAPEEPQEPAQEDAAEPVEEVVPEPAPAPQKPNLVTYAEAAAMADVAPETIRGAANGPRARLSKYQTTEGPRVDLDEVRKVYNRRPVGA